jgi:predicted dinucleotide-binding enzyme
MGLRAFVSMNIAVIGNCRTTAMVAEKLARAGHKIYIGLVDGQPDNVTFSEYMENIYFDTIEDAAEISELIIITAPVEKVREVAYLMGDVRKKVIVDISSNHYGKPDQYIYSVRAIRAITGAEHVIKAYSPSDNEIAFAEKELRDLFLAGDSKKAKAFLTIIAADLGYKNIYDFGDQETIPMLEDMARCWRNLAITQKMGEKIAFKIVRR